MGRNKGGRPPTTSLRILAALDAFGRPAHATEIAAHMEGRISAVHVCHVLNGHVHRGLTERCGTAPSVRGGTPHNLYRLTPAGRSLAAEAWAKIEAGEL